MKISSKNKYYKRLPGIYWLAESDEPFDLFMKYLFGEWLFPCKQTETQAQNHRTGRDFKDHWLQSTPNAGIYLP